MSLYVGEYRSSQLGLDPADPAHARLLELLGPFVTKSRRAYCLRVVEGDDGWDIGKSVLSDWSVVERLRFRDRLRAFPSPPPTIPTEASLEIPSDEDQLADLLSQWDADDGSLFLLLESRWQSLIEHFAPHLAASLPITLGFQALNTNVANHWPHLSEMTVWSSGETTNVDSDGDVPEVEEKAWQPLFAGNPSSRFTIWMEVLVPMRAAAQRVARTLRPLVFAISGERAFRLQLSVGKKADDWCLRGGAVIGHRSHLGGHGSGTIARRVAVGSYGYLSPIPFSIPEPGGLPQTFTPTAFRNLIAPALGTGGRFAAGLVLLGEWLHSPDAVAQSVTFDGAWTTFTLRQHRFRNLAPT